MEERSLPWGQMAVGLILVSLFGAWVFLGPGAIWIESVSSVAAARWTDVANWYQLKLEGSAKLLAPLITIVSGTYALVKAYKYAEARLHYRLHDFIKRDEARLSEARSKMRMLVDKPGLKREFSEPAFLDEHLRSAVRELGWGSYFLPPQIGLVEYQLGSAIAQIEHQSALSIKRQRHLELQLATAHLLKGALWVATASKLKSDGQDDRLGLTNAASHFSAAVQINPDDEEALEYLAQVYVRLEQTDEASIALDKVLQLTAKQEKSLPRARALRSKARIAEAQGTPMVAVRHLRRALEVLPNLFGDDRIEEAEINEAIADCQARVGNKTQARAHWEVARALYATVQNEEAAKRRETIEAKLCVPSTPPLQLN